MPDIIKKEDFIKAAGLDKFNMEALAKILMGITGVNKLNKLYDSAFDREGLDFVDQIFENLGIECEVDEKELKRIPATGAFLTVSNHPFGGLDGLLLLKVLGRIRPDYKLMANFLLKNVKPIEDYFIAVNPFEQLKGKVSSLEGMKLSIAHLQNGGGLGIFPAGEVSTLQGTFIADREWQKPALKLIKRAHQPIIPVYFQGSNSAIFHILGLVHPLLRTAVLPSEMFKKRNSVIKVRIGNPISLKEQDDFGDDIDRFGRFLRAKTYSLGSALEVHRHFYLPTFLFPSKPENIAEGFTENRLKDEVESLAHYRIHSQQQFDIYIAPANEIPCVLHEIGRQRELTFRGVGEGTNKSIDLDEYDLYYQHIFLWDKEAAKLVGAYRLGKGEDIMKQYGKKGFYTNSLFKMNDAFEPILEKSIELGRSFIVKEYQQHRLPLFMLWKGILYFLIKNPEYRYLIGPVSISNQYSTVSKSLIVAFIKAYFYNEELAQHIKPRKIFKAKLKTIDLDAILNVAKDDMQKIDKFIAEFEPTHHAMPVLLKKYIKQNAKIIGFNLDPKFNDALDGLMILDLNDVPNETIDNLRKDFELH